MTKSESKSLKQIIKQGKAEKKRIDDRIKSAKSKAGRAYYDFINANYHVSASKYPNGRIKLLKLSRDGKEVDLTKRSPHSDSNPVKSNEATQSESDSAVANNQSSSSSDSANSNSPHLIKPNQHNLH